MFDYDLECFHQTDTVVSFDMTEVNPDWLPGCLTLSQYQWLSSHKKWSTIKLRTLFVKSFSHQCQGFRLYQQLREWRNFDDARKSIKINLEKFSQLPVHLLELDCVMKTSLVVWIIVFLYTWSKFQIRNRNSWISFEDFHVFISYLTMNLDVYRWTRVGHRPPSCPSVNCLYYKLDKLDLESSNSYNPTNTTRHRTFSDFGIKPFHKFCPNPLSSEMNSAPMTLVLHRDLFSFLLSYFI